MLRKHNGILSQTSKKELTMREVTSRDRFIVLWIVTAVLLVFAQMAPATDSQCALDGMKASDGTLGYKKRQKLKLSSSRCEGLYQSPVNSKFEVLSLLWGSISYKNDSILQVHWPSQSHLSSLFVTGTSKSPGIFYRMDAVIDGKLPFHWPVSEVLAKSGVSSQNLGVLGWFKTNGKIVYVPLTVTDLSQSKTISDKETATLVVRADFDLERVILRKFGDPSMSNWTVIHERFSAGEPISVDLKKWIPVAKDENFPLQIVGKIIDDEEQIIETFYVRFLR